MLKHTILGEVEERWQRAQAAYSEISERHQRELAALQGRQRSERNAALGEEQAIGDEWRAIVVPLNALAERLYVDPNRPKTLTDGEFRVAAVWANEAVEISGYYRNDAVMGWSVTIRPPRTLLGEPSYVITTRFTHREGEHWSYFEVLSGT